MNLNNLKQNWDLIVIGGGITGAGILREALRLGMDALLLEQNDFTWGTSSRSSKLVHGGLRYLEQGRLHLTRASVIEREHLLQDASGLVEPLEFLVPVFYHQKPGRLALKTGLCLYDLIALKRGHQYYPKDRFIRLVPGIRRTGLLGGYGFYDAQADDCRLVLRLLGESAAAGAAVLNYTRAVAILRDENGHVKGVTARDMESDITRELATRAVINATGVWAEGLHPLPEKKRHLRPLRGSHLVFPKTVLPLKCGISFSHPADHRSVFVVPWENVILVGTTDIDHDQDLFAEPAITVKEAAYLLDGIRSVFPSGRVISASDCIATFAGVRPVLSRGKKSASKESREHVVWKDRGLVTVTGGKLTTFRRLAWDALKAARPFLPEFSEKESRMPAFSLVPSAPIEDHGLTAETWRRLYGRYGNSAAMLVGAAAPGDLETIGDTAILWAELPFVAKHEWVRHLPDLLLRRVRLGLLTPGGGRPYLERIQKLCEPGLSWGPDRWAVEIKDYLDLWQRAYKMPVIPGTVILKSTKKGPHAKKR
jgi:glycerol-3-phosphate dehydrogenase